MRVLVTGATGFIGRRPVEQLLGENHEVICVSRKEISADTFSGHA